MCGIEPLQNAWSRTKLPAWSRIILHRMVLTISRPHDNGRSRTTLSHVVRTTRPRMVQDHTTTHGLGPHVHAWSRTTRPRMVSATRPRMVSDHTTAHGLGPHDVHD